MKKESLNIGDYEKINPLSGDYSRQNFSCIYAIVSKRSGRMYIGSAKHFGIRRRNHVNSLIKNRHHSIILQRHYDKYGIDDLYFIVFELVEWNLSVIQKEQFYLDEHSPYFNILKVAYSSIGRKFSQETIKKLSESHKGIKPSAESLEKRRISMIKTAANLSEEKKKRRREANHSKRKKVICLDTGEVLESAIAAGKSIGVRSVCMVCTGYQKTVKGFKFRYI